MSRKDTCLFGRERIVGGGEYSDESIVCCIESSGLLDEDCYLLSPLLNVSNRLKKTRIGLAPVIVAPVNRNGRHWVLYILQKTPRGTYKWSFGDSMGGGARAAEVQRIASLLDIMTTNLSFDVPALADISILPIPRQPDIVSCGAYVTEAALRFLAKRERRWPGPRELREKHARIVEQYYR